MKLNFIDALIAYEQDELNYRQEIEFLAYLIKRKLYKTLQRHYGRVAKYLIESGYVNSDGTLTTEFYTNKSININEPLIIIEDE